MLEALRHERRGDRPRQLRHLRHRLLAAILSLVAVEASFVSCSRTQSRRPEALREAGKEPFEYGQAKQPGQPYGNQAPQDPQDLIKQLFGDLGGAGGPNAGNAAENPFAAMMGAGQPKKKTSDSFFVDRIPVLQRIKRPVLIAFFVYCFYRGWVGRWGLVFGCMAGSYFDMLAVPLRVSERSPFTGRAYVMTQIYVDYFFKLLGYIINVAKGKAKFPPDFSKMLTPPTGAGAGQNPFAPGANPFAPGKSGENAFSEMMNAFDVSPGQAEQYQSPPVQPTDMPTAPTVGAPPRPPATPAVATSSTPMSTPLTVEPVAQAPKPPSRSKAPVVDADVTFLD